MFELLLKYTNQVTNQYCHHPDFSFLKHVVSHSNEFVRIFYRGSHKDYFQLKTVIFPFLYKSFYTRNIHKKENSAECVAMA